MLVRLTNTPRDYAWGSTTLLAGLEGRAPTGAPEAEVWFGDHPGAPATVADGTGLPLDRWLAAHNRPPLPYLLKLLAAAHPLSIQAHPSKAQAQAGFAREVAAGVPRDAAHRNYRDDNHKPELIVAVSDAFGALAGLREIAATRRLFAQLPNTAGVRAVRERLQTMDATPAAVLARLVPWLLSPAASDVVADVLKAVAGTRFGTEFPAELAFARRLLDEVPGDPGIVVALFMNLVVLRRGEGLFLPAGVLHAYFDGLGVEVMAASDNVLRGGLTEKHVDVAELGAVLDATPGPVEVLRPVPGDDGVAGYPVPVPDFALRCVRVSDRPVALTPRGAAIALVTAGEVELSDGAEAVLLRPGQAALTDAPLQVRGTGELFLAEPGG